jgi:hypothetical protein
MSFSNAHRAWNLLQGRQPWKHVYFQILPSSNKGKAWRWLW